MWKTFFENLPVFEKLRELSEAELVLILIAVLLFYQVSKSLTVQLIEFTSNKKYKHFDFLKDAATTNGIDEKNKKFLEEQLSRKAFHIETGLDADQPIRDKIITLVQKKKINVSELKSIRGLKISSDGDLEFKTPSPIKYFVAPVFSLAGFAIIISGMFFLALYYLASIIEDSSFFYGMVKSILIASPGFFLKYVNQTFLDQIKLERSLQKMKEENAKEKRNPIQKAFDWYYRKIHKFE